MLFLGDICQQFTSEMFDMYQGFAFYKTWDFEVLNYTPAEYGTSCLSVFQSNGGKKTIVVPSILSYIILVSVVPESFISFSEH